MPHILKATRRALERAPLLPPALAAVAGAALGVRAGAAWAWLTGAAAAAAAAGLHPRARPAALGAALALLAGALAAGSAALNSAAVKAHRSALPLRPIEVLGTVADAPDPGDHSTTFLLQAHRLRPQGGEEPWRRWEGRLRVTLYGAGRRLSGGEKVLLSGKPYLPRGGPYRAHLDRLGASAYLSAGSRETLLLERGSGPRSSLFRLRRKLSLACERLVPGEDGDVLRAVLLGERRGVSDETWEAFRQSGTVHLLAISGLHLGLLGGIVALAAGAAGLPRRPRWLVTLTILTLYALLTGARTPVLRATMMAWALGITVLAGRQYSPLNSLALAAGAIALVKPAEVTSPGFQLSFLATLGIIALVPPAARRLARLPAPAKVPLVALAVSGAAQLAASPALAAHFGQVPLLALFVNLAAAPLLGVVLLLALPALALELALPPLASALAPPLRWSLATLRLLCTSAASLPLATVRTGQVPGPALALWGAALASVLLAGLAVQTSEGDPR